MTDDTQAKILLGLVDAHKPFGDWTSKPAIAASTVDVPNTSDSTMWVFITGGTVTVVKVDGVTIGAATSGWFRVRKGGKISITYSVAPTWQWFF